jgi:hypothetical protein
MQLTRRALLLVTCAALGGCAAAPPAEIAVVTEYLECKDCAAMALRPVIALGDTAVPVLRWVLEHGPSPERIAQERTYAAESHERILRYAAQHPGFPHIEADTIFVADAVMRLDARTRLRAARALLRIGTRQAVAAVCRASGQPPTARIGQGLRDLIRDAAVRC